MNETRDRLLSELVRFLPAGSLLSDPEDLRPYECDGLSAYRQLPMLVALPENAEQVQRILRLCHLRNVPVVARGAGTGLSGGALPLADGVLLSLAKLNKILAIDPANRTARVQPGVRNLAISQAAAPLRALLRPRSLVPDRLHHRRQRRRERRRGALPEVRTDRAQRAGAQVVTMDGELLTLGGRGAGCTRLRSARADDRLGRHARRHRRGHRQAAAQARTRAGRARRL